MPTPTVPVSLTVNGSSTDLDLDVRTSLLGARIAGIAAAVADAVAHATGTRVRDLPVRVDRLFRAEVQPAS